MKISLNWIKEYINLNDVTTDELKNKLISDNIECYDIKKFGTKINDASIVKIKSVKPNPIDSNKNDIFFDINGKEETTYTDLVNIKEGDTVCVIENLVNKGVINILKEKYATKYPPFEVLKYSHLKLDEQYNSLKQYFSNDEYQTFISEEEWIGMDINEILGLEDEILYIDNEKMDKSRMDLMCVEGIAKELSRLFNKPLIKKCYRDREDIELKKVDIKNGYTLSMDDDLCDKCEINFLDNIDYNVKDIKVVVKLLKSGINHINNVVDIANYVMLEQGMPVQVFNTSKIINKNLSICNSENGDYLTSLNGKKINLGNNEIVFKNENNVIDLIGVGINKEYAINSNISSVGIKVNSCKMGSLKYNFKFVSNYSKASLEHVLMHSEIPVKLCESAMYRVTELLNEKQIAICDYSVIDKDYSYFIDNKVLLDHAKINDILGTDMTENDVTAIMNRLKLEYKYGIVSIPYYRKDLIDINDLAREILNIYNINNIRFNQTGFSLDNTVGKKSAFDEMIKYIKNILVSNNYNEIESLSVLNKDKVIRGVSKDYYNDKVIKLTNNEVYLPNSIISILDILEENSMQGNKEINVFTINRTAFKDKDGIKENVVLSIGASGKHMDFFKLKSIIMAILSRFGLSIDDITEEVKIVESKDYSFYPKVSADIMIDEEKIVTFGKINPSIVYNYSVNSNCHIAIIDLEQLFNIIN